MKIGCFEKMQVRVMYLHHFSELCGVSWNDFSNSSKELIKAKTALTFLLVKKDGYKEGEEITLVEHKDGSATGKEICVIVQSIWQDWTGLDDDYCIIGFQAAGIQI